MKFKSGEFITEIYEISSLYQILCEKNQIGEPYLLLVYLDNQTITGANDKEKSAVAEFFGSLPYVTAIVSDEPLKDDISSLFDFTLTKDEVESFTDKLYNEKTKKQIDEINACFKIKGENSAEKILELESKAFYRLMAEKNGGSADEL